MTSFQSLLWCVPSGLRWSAKSIDHFLETLNGSRPDERERRRLLILMDNGGVPHRAGPRLECRPLGPPPRGGHRNGCEETLTKPTAETDGDVKIWKRRGLLAAAWAAVVGHRSSSRRPRRWKRPPPAIRRHRQRRSPIPRSARRDHAWPRSFSYSDARRGVHRADGCFVLEGWAPRRRGTPGESTGLFAACLARAVEAPGPQAYWVTATARASACSGTSDDGIGVIGQVSVGEQRQHDRASTA